MGLPGKTHLKKLLREVYSKIVRESEGDRLRRVISNRVEGFPSTSTKYRVGIVGAGGVAAAHVSSIKTYSQVEIAGITEQNSERLNSFAEKFKIPTQKCYTDISEMLNNAGSFDLVMVTTTALGRISLAQKLVESGIKRIFLEKPIDNSLKLTRTFNQVCSKNGVSVAVNYLRRWSLNYGAIKKCINDNMVGEVRSLTVLAGKGELAMNGSHFFDLSRFILDDDPDWVVSHLDPVTDINPRGTQFKDPGGYCMFQFEGGARVFIDFSQDYLNKGELIIIKGTQGQIIVDERNRTWQITTKNRHTFTYPLADPQSIVQVTPRIISDLLSDKEPLCSGIDGEKALEMIIASYLSSENDHQPVKFPVPDDKADIDLVFP